MIITFTRFIDIHVKCVVVFVLPSFSQICKMSSPKPKKLASVIVEPGKGDWQKAWKDQKQRIDKELASSKDEFDYDENLLQDEDMKRILDGDIDGKVPTFGVDPPPPGFEDEAAIEDNGGNGDEDSIAANFPSPNIDVKDSKESKVPIKKFPLKKTAAFKRRGASRPRATTALAILKNRKVANAFKAKKASSPLINPKSKNETAPDPDDHRVLTNRKPAFALPDVQPVPIPERPMSAIEQVVVFGESRPVAPSPEEIRAEANRWLAGRRLPLRLVELWRSKGLSANPNHPAEKAKYAQHGRDRTTVYKTWRMTGQANEALDKIIWEQMLEDNIRPYRSISAERARHIAASDAGQQRRPVKSASASELSSGRSNPLSSPAGKEQLLTREQWENLYKSPHANPVSRRDSSVQEEFEAYGRSLKEKEEKLKKKRDYLIAELRKTDAESAALRADRQKFDEVVAKSRRVDMNPQVHHRPSSFRPHDMTTSPRMFDVGASRSPAAPFDARQPRPAPPCPWLSPQAGTGRRPPMNARASASATRTDVDEL